MDYQITIDSANNGYILTVRKNFGERPSIDFEAIATTMVDKIKESEVDRIINQNRIEEKDLSGCYIFSTKKEVIDFIIKDLEFYD